jgi:hypothetical protein
MVLDSSDRGRASDANKADWSLGSAPRGPAAARTRSRGTHTHTRKHRVESEIEGGPSAASNCDVYAIDVLRAGLRRPLEASRVTNQSARTQWTNEIPIKPSPTADATRLMSPHRTSPTANMPGRDVSSRLRTTSSIERTLSQRTALGRCALPLVACRASEQASARSRRSA